VSVSKLYVLVYDTSTKNEYLWTKAKFLNRQSYMQEMYGTFESTGSVPNVPQVATKTEWFLRIFFIFHIYYFTSPMIMCVRIMGLQSVAYI